jgi:hypothetical protein
MTHMSDLPPDASPFVVVLFVVCMFLQVAVPAWAAWSAWRGLREARAVTEAMRAVSAREREGR